MGVLWLYVFYMALGLVVPIGTSQGDLAAPNQAILDRSRNLHQASMKEAWKDREIKRQDGLADGSKMLVVKERADSQD